MRILKWCGRHKVWAFWIVAIVGMIVYNCFGTGTMITSGSITTGDNSYEQGGYIARVFLCYLMIIWLYSGIKRLRTKG